MSPDLFSMTWLMPMDATRPQPRAMTIRISDLGRMIFYLCIVSLRKLSTGSSRTGHWLLSFRMAVEAANCLFAKYIGAGSQLTLAYGTLTDTVIGSPTAAA